MCKIYTDNLIIDRGLRGHPVVLDTLGTKESFIALDTTAKSAWIDMGEAFSPTSNMTEESDWEEYTKQYTDLMRERYVEQKNLFLKALSYDRLVLRCDCEDTSETTKRCHRYLLVDILLKIAKSNGLQARYMGEVTKEKFKHVMGMTYS